ncbi:MAG: CopG family transcriptional regulator [Deltaproteobacteria bacterium HGW-Deltaproteobacteria-12]|jgi:RHH-type rel operon transcriptional repressor/antitoxin RelB|nr:MAG: CopG family transcriptional regulator [Deltaproteobacteria bacterium HGW-Deltaproteobacteria-12]
MLAIRLPEGIEERLDILAKATGRTKTFYAREAILEHLDDLEDIYLADKRYGAVRSGRVKSVSLKDVEKQYDMED